MKLFLATTVLIVAGLLPKANAGSGIRSIWCCTKTGGGLRVFANTRDPDPGAANTLEVKINGAAAVSVSPDTTIADPIADPPVPLQSSAFADCADTPIEVQNCVEARFQWNIFDFPTGTVLEIVDGTNELDERPCAILSSFYPVFINTQGSGVHGDPHFSTWRGEKYDYHGQCDLELVSDPTFAKGKGLMVYVRAEIVRSWSYIKTAAIRIGDDILEVKGGMDDNHYWFNKEYKGALTTIGGLPVTYKKANSKSHSYVINLGGKKTIEVRTYKNFVRVNFNKPTKELYGNTVGLLGDFASGKKLARDGVTVIEDYNEFGQEWQVPPGAPQLFHEVSGPQSSLEQCILPKKIARRLGEAKITDLEAEVACEKAGVPEHELHECVYDVLTTDDLEMAGAY